MNEYVAEFTAELAHQRAIGLIPPDSDRPHVECSCDEHRGRARGRGFTGLRRLYSWAVPDQVAIETIKQWSPGGVVEIGAGGGYWAGLIREAGVRVYACDPQPAPSEWASRLWSPVVRWPNDGQPSDETVDWIPANSHVFFGRTLLMVKPTGFASRMVDMYRGDTVIFVGSTYDDPGVDPEGWAQESRWALPSYADVQDYIEVYTRD